MTYIIGTKHFSIVPSLPVKGHKIIIRENKKQRMVCLSFSTLGTLSAKKTLFLHEQGT